MKLSGKILFFCLLFVITTPLAALSIDRLKSNPERYKGDTVRLSGEVTFVAGIPFTDLQVYILEDNSGSLLVFTAFPKELDERTRIKAEVIAYIGDNKERDREDAINRISDYLVEKEILERKAARKVSEISLKFLNTVADAATGVWFVIEQEKTGFLNL
ncbi:hypothetical protein [Spirochaeta isovalerica]|uniref:Uncharacterized protein n=1 Tax=Spirochaeta isovalerica TaxID=150 RepID=A0A841R8E5_9SPIO|nr:hypothetical protein [Spirochaeta isovalerica]MBB6478742.1 hypothetical protein [Spirochaeta isovalerica]